VRDISKDGGLLCCLHLASNTTGLVTFIAVGECMYGDIIYARQQQRVEVLPVEWKIL
jgi:hypothetical protein